jgi:hypothetical protein
MRGGPFVRNATTAALTLCGTFLPLPFVTNRGQRPTSGGRCDIRSVCLMVQHLPQPFSALTVQKRPPLGEVGRGPAGFALVPGPRKAPGDRRPHRT